MNKKFLMFLPMLLAECEATEFTEVVFNGCSNTSNNYFTFTRGTSAYDIKACTPKVTTSLANKNVILRIPALVSGNQVSVQRTGFYWSNYDSRYAMNVKLVFEKVNNSYVIAKDCYGLFYEGIDSYTSYARKIEIDLSGLYIGNNISSMYCMFYGCETLTNITFPPANAIDTSSVTDMSNMFRFCGTLQSLDLSHFNTSKVTNMQSMFSKCYELKEIDVSSFDTSNVTDMSYMFRECDQLQSLDLDHFNTSKVTTMNAMFAICPKLTSLDLSHFDTRSLTIMQSMFYQCYGLKSVDLSNFNTSAVTTMQSMFYQCYDLTDVNVSSFDTSKLQTMRSMFKECSSLETLDISNFDTNTNDFNSALQCFSGCVKLGKLAISRNITAPTEHDEMFASCKDDLHIVCTDATTLSEASNALKTDIAGENSEKVYVMNGDSLISESFKNVIETQRPNALILYETDVNLISTTLDDVLYIGLNTEVNSLLIENHDGTVLGKLVNKVIPDCGYTPSALQINSNITFANDNSEFVEKSVTVGDGIKNAKVTFTNPTALPQTEIIVEKNGVLDFSGTEKYTLAHNVIIKSGAGIMANTRLQILTNGLIMHY